MLSSMVQKPSYPLFLKKNEEDDKFIGRRFNIIVLG